jgi:hypothetical protein
MIKRCIIHRIVVAVSLFAVPAIAVADDDPFAAPKPGTNKPAEKPKAGWGDEKDLRIPVDSKNQITFGLAGCPVAVVGPSVVDLKTSKPVRDLEGSYEPRGLRSLGTTGKFFAAASKTPNITDTTVTVWATDTGKKALEVPGRRDAYVDFLAVARDKYLLIGGRHNNKIEVWDIETGKTTKTLTVPDRRVEPGKIAFTPDGKYFACIAHDKLVVQETATGKQAAILEAPPVKAMGGPPKPKNIETIFVYSWTQALRWSPDGDMLALYTTHPYPRLLCWNLKGKLIVDEPAAMPQIVSHQSSLEWSADSKYWLVNGYLFDRESKKLLLSIRTPFAADVMPHLLDKDRVAGTFGEDSSVVRAVTIPWEKLAAALKQMNDKTPAYIAPYQAVSLDVSLAGARGDAEDTRRFLVDALTQRLARNGVSIANGQSTGLRLRVSEEAGATLPIYERQSPFDFRGKETGRSATESKGAATLELIAAGEPTPLWRAALTASSARSFTEEINDATVRKSMFEHLIRQLNGMDIPYFIPKSRDIVALPAVIE